MLTCFDDFAKYPAGWLNTPIAYLGAANVGNSQPIQEYHYVADHGVPLGPWENPISHLSDAWMVSDEDGKTYLENQFDRTSRHFTNPLLITGDPEWDDYAVEAKVRPLSMNCAAGLVFRYHTNSHYYSFDLSDGNKVTLSVRLPIEIKLRKRTGKRLPARNFTTTQSDITS